MAILQTFKEGSNHYFCSWWWERRTSPKIITCIQLFRERLSENWVHATIPKGIVGGFEFSFVQRNLKELAGKAMEMCLRLLKESNKSRFDSYSRQEQSIDHIPCYLSGLSRAHFFLTTFLKIAVLFWSSIHTCQDCSIYLKVACIGFPCGFGARKDWGMTLSFGRVKNGTRAKKLKRGEGSGKKKVLADKPRDFENPDWLG